MSSTAHAKIERKDITKTSSDGEIFYPKYNLEPAGYFIITVNSGAFVVGGGERSESQSGMRGCWVGNRPFNDAQDGNATVTVIIQS